MTRTIISQRRAELRGRLSDEELALYRSFCGSGASAWMDVPLDARYVIPDDRCVERYSRSLRRSLRICASLWSSPVMCSWSDGATMMRPRVSEVPM